MPTIQQAVAACRSVEAQERLHAKRRAELREKGQRMLWAALLAGAAVALFVAGMRTGQVIERNNWRFQAIKRCVARYNPVTAEFEWIDRTD